ncbi:MAG: PaaI family thioesterase [Pseudomonadota bacterium]
MANPADMMPFSKLMGVEITSVSPEKVEATLVVRPDLCTGGNIMHGGAVMAYADAVGAIGAYATLPKDAKGTTTIESKTNFLAAAPEGDTITAVATPLSTGRRVSVWQTAMHRSDGKQIAMVTQTQLVLR